MIVLFVLLMLSNMGFAESIADIYGNRSESESDLRKYAPQVDLPLKITLKDDVKTSSPFIYLSDLLQCQGQSEQCLQIESALFSESPLPGRSIQVMSSEIQEVLKAELGSRKVEVSGSDIIKVQSLSAEVSKSQLKEDLEKSANKILGREDFKVSVGDLTIRGNVYVRPGNLDYEIIEKEKFSQWVQGLRSIRQASKRILVRAKHEQQEGGSSQFPVFVRFKFENFVPVTSKRLMPGMIVREDHIEYSWVPYDHRVIHRAEEILGKKLKRSLAQGKAFTKAMLAIPLAVRRGQSVDVSMKTGNLSVKTKGRAAESGSVGDVITISLKSSMKKVKAKVLSSGKVKVIN